MKSETVLDIQSLQEQIKWVKEQDRILEEIEGKLYEMKAIAEYASENKLTFVERNKLHGQMEQLKVIGRTVKFISLIGGHPKK